MKKVKIYLIIKVTKRTSITLLALRGGRYKQERLPVWSYPPIQGMTSQTTIRLRIVHKIKFIYNHEQSFSNAQLLCFFVLHSKGFVSKIQTTNK